MSNANRDDDLFVRIKDGKIVEPFVQRLHIKNRQHPFHWYTRVLETPAPEVPEFHYLESKPVLTLTGEPVLEHTLIEKDIDQVLRELAIPVEGEDEFDITYEAPNISEVPQATIDYIYKKLGEHFHDKLNEFAKGRNYDSLTTLLNYEGSVIPQFAQEAQRAKQLRDGVWAVLLPFFDSVVQGNTPIPLSLEEIEALVPELTWEE